MATNTQRKSVVLIVEKDKVRADQYFRNLTEQMHGHALVRVDAANGEAALKLLSTRHVDLVVCSGSILTPDKARIQLDKPPCS